MARPKEYENLKQTPLMLEYDMVELCKFHNVNISAVCRKAIRNVLSDNGEIKKYQPEDKFKLIPKETIGYWKKIVLNDKTPAMIKIRACCKTFQRLTGKRFTPIEVKARFEQETA